MSNVAAVSKKERVEWARTRVVDAARLAAKYSQDGTYRAALAARVKELEEAEQSPGR